MGQWNDPMEIECQECKVDQAEVVVEKPSKNNEGNDVDPENIRRA